VRNWISCSLRRKIEVMTRTFIALELDSPQQHFLGSIIRQGRQILPALRWVDAAGIHLTLAFLGELDDDRLAQAMGAARSAAALCAPFTYRFSGLGTFGAARQPRVLWMGVSEPSGALHQVHQRLALALEQQGFPREQRPFSPHLTLARITFPLTPAHLQVLQELLASYQFSSAASRVSHISVMKSELARSGARYTCLQTYACDGR
jgi:2'-5' RNA ligase